MEFKRWFADTYEPGKQRADAARALAKKCGCKKKNVDHWVNGTRPVPLHHVLVIGQFSAQKVTLNDLLKAMA